MSRTRGAVKGSFGFSALTHVFNDSSQDVRSKIIGIYTFLILFNIIIWALAIVAFSGAMATLGLAVTAYTFGLRHAVDADHISAVDNVTRKLMQEDKRPISVGFFFGLGHSTIVLGLCIVIGITASVIKDFDALKNIGGFIGASVSAVFLYLIALLNVVILWDIFKTFQKVKRGEEYNEQTLNDSLNQRGLMARFFGPLLRATDKSWKMYPIGLLFGLGFDTATEVGIMSLTALLATQGHLPIWSILIFPLLFMAGMCLIDTTDGILMLGAYGWAFVKPVRKLYYNLNITLISVLVAFVVGTIEVLGIMSNALKLSGPFWGQVGNLNDNFGFIGYLIIGIFVVSWLVSTVIYKVKRYDDLMVSTAPKPTNEIIAEEAATPGLANR
ncbi:HoxN/HupN/NixA family nickel/cobalt transporter [Dictyobacter aurantiacus]|uniref:Nickel/cobalt efflux system n=1 Tax=Dictyobacter aurantiacus TaxID=1936993 RepID=A0A401ZNG5_9CHLR|nr:HoxN/HupN/NixA family nickel/cobalt transporter [Dictyobacter aurantiacus]GCE08306.1 nickel/cobalt efflux system [Dictyobacter aurantiacus]